MKIISATLAAALLAAALAAPVQASPLDTPTEYNGISRCFPILC